MPWVLKTFRGGVLEQIAASQRELDAVVSERKTRLKELKKVRDAAKRDYQQEVSSCKKALKDANEELGRHVMTVGKIVLYGDRVVAGKTTIPLSENIEAEVSTSGSLLTHTTIKDKGPNIAGAVIGDVIAGPKGAIIGGQKKIKSESKVEDARSLYVTIVSDGANAVVEVDPKKEFGARKLVAEIKTQARSFEKRKAESAKAISKAKDDLERAQAKTDEMDEAERKYSEYKNDTSAIDVAKDRHDAFVASLDQEEIAKAKKAARKRGASKTYSIVAVVIGSFFALLGLDLMTATPGGAPAGTIVLLIADLLLVTAWMVFSDRRAAAKESE